MTHAQTMNADLNASCQRSFGRAEVALEAKLEITRGQFACVVSDLSLDGACVETNQTVVPGQDVWLRLHRLKIFATVQWQRAGSIGVRFEQKLPKAFVMRLLGEDVDREAYKEAEALLAAHDWVLRGATRQTRSLSAADLLGARNSKTGASSYVAGQDEVSLSGTEQLTEPKDAAKRRVAVILVLAATVGSLVGLGTLLVF